MRKVLNGVMWKVAMQSWKALVDPSYTKCCQTLRKNLDLQNGPSSICLPLVTFKKSQLGYRLVQPSDSNSLVLMARRECQDANTILKTTKTQPSCFPGGFGCVCLTRRSWCALLSEQHEWMHPCACVSLHFMGIRVLRMLQNHVPT